MWFLKYSISRRISITVIALAAILIALWIAELFSLVSVQAEASRQALTHSAQTTMNAVEAQIERYATAGRVLALSPALLRDDIATFEAEAARATTALGDAWVLLARPEGEQIFNARNAPFSFPMWAGPRRRCKRNGVPFRPEQRRSPMLGSACCLGNT